MLIFVSEKQDDPQNSSAILNIRHTLFAEARRTADFTMKFVDTARHQYALSPKSRYRRAATDGTDPGADIETLRAAVGRGLLP